MTSYEIGDIVRCVKEWTVPNLGGDVVFKIGDIGRVKSCDHKKQSRGHKKHIRIHWSKHVMNSYISDGSWWSPVACIEKVSFEPASMSPPTYKVGDIVRCVKKGYDNSSTALAPSPCEVGDIGRVASLVGDIPRVAWSGRRRFGETEAGWIQPADCLEKVVFEIKEDAVAPPPPTKLY
jgi:hypothetical protein